MGGLQQYLRVTLMSVAVVYAGACADEPVAETPMAPFVVVTFNTGTSENMGHDAPPDDGYDGAKAKISDTWYGDGLAWLPAVAATRAFFAEIAADVVVFQEIFWAGRCPDIPTDAHDDFYCKSWQAGDITVALDVLGPGWQVMCNPGKPDKCAAVRRAFGSFQGCKEDFCLEGMQGFQVNDCGKGVRTGRATIDLVAGGSLTVVNIHGSSGFKAEVQACRVKQFDQAFVDLGDGEPGANGARNLVMGDLNTDPARFADFDPSAARIHDFVGPDKAFQFLSEVGKDAPPSYQGIVNIDHVTSDAFEGTCKVAGLTDELPAVIDAIYFDHKPVVCTAKPR